MKNKVLTAQKNILNRTKICIIYVTLTYATVLNCEHLQNVVSFLTIFRSKLYPSKHKSKPPLALQTYSNVFHPGVESVKKIIRINWIVLIIEWFKK